MICYTTSSKNPSIIAVFSLLLILVRIRIVHLQDIRCSHFSKKTTGTDLPHSTWLSAFKGTGRSNLLPLEEALSLFEDRI